jgi:hypothetical protein
MKLATYTVTHNNGKPIVGIIPLTADLPSWKRRAVQPLGIDSESVSRMILDERNQCRK